MKYLPLALAAGACLLLASGADAASRKGGGANAGAGANAAAFDGRWSVMVITEQGTCDRAYRWSLGVRGGQVVEMGDNIAEASGQIDPRGRVSVRFTRGADVLSAQGALSGDSGSGTWRAPSRQCAGRWEAEKRS